VVSATDPHGRILGFLDHFRYIRIYKTIILPVVPHESETWSLTLREKHSLRVFVNRVLRKYLDQGKMK
jgi:hypothetical protein